jgi:hypothetical protein
VLSPFASYSRKIDVVVVFIHTDSYSPVTCNERNTEKETGSLESSISIRHKKREE